MFVYVTEFKIRNNFVKSIVSASIIEALVSDMPSDLEYSSNKQRLFSYYTSSCFL